MRKKKIKQAVIKYANWLVQLVLMLKPKNLILILGRGTGKTSDIMAQRFQQVAYDMAGCYIALSSDTYMNARKNVIPALMEGWKRNDWHEDYHFVVGKRPPKKWIKKSYKAPVEFKDTITVFNGTHVKIISQDRPSTGAGDSYQHIFGDEVKFQAEKKINKLNPAVRGGDLKFRKSPFYGGRTFTTDMPNINHGEHDWILNYEKNVNKEQLQLMMQCAFIINEIKIEVEKAREDEDKKELELAERKLKRWQKRFKQLRKGSTFFYIGSSFINADVLGYSFFKDVLESMNFNDVSTSILSLSPKLEKGEKFYPNLNSKNFYKDGWDYTRIEQIPLSEKVEECSQDLKYINPNQPIEAGLDTGNMCGLVTGQHQGDVIRAFKEFYTIPEDFLPELAGQFREFYRFHKKKHLLLWPDPTSNKYKAVGDDHASKFKAAVEYDKDGKSTDWTVTIMNEDEGIIYQQTEYELMLEFQSGSNRQLPTIQIFEQGCPCLKSSMELAKKIIRVNKEGQKTIHKDKSSEKLPAEKLPMHSTNMSDAGKYFFCRSQFLDVIKGETISYKTLPTS